MATSLDILYKNRSLTKQINEIVGVEPFVLKNIFKNVERHSSEIINVEIIKGYSDVAEFSDMNADEPKPISKTTKTVKELTIPRTFESKVFSVQELKDITNLANNTDLSPDERKSLIAEYLDRQLTHLKQRALRLNEKMAIEALSTGKITVNQDDLKFTFDFGYVANKQKATLTGSDTWDTATDGVYTADIPGIIHTYRKKVPGANMLILDPDASDLFRKNAKVIKDLDTNNLKTGQLDFNDAGNDAVIPIGKFRGLNVYEYIQTYDVSGTDTNMLGENKALILNTNKHFALHRAPVYRIESNSLTSYMKDYYVQSFTNRNKTTLEWQVEQKAVPAIFDLSSVFALTVA